MEAKEKDNQGEVSSCTGEADDKEIWLLKSRVREAEWGGSALRETGCDPENSWLWGGTREREGRPSAEKAKCALQEGRIIPEEFIEETTFWNSEKKGIPALENSRFRVSRMSHFYIFFSWIFV